MGFWKTALAVCTGILLAACVYFAAKMRIDYLAAQRAAESRHQLIEQETANIKKLNETLEAEMQKAKEEKLARGARLDREHAVRVNNALDLLHPCPNDEKYLCWMPADGTGPWGPFPTRAIAVTYISKHPEHK